MTRRQWLAIILIGLMIAASVWTCSTNTEEIELPPPPPNVDSIKRVYDSAVAAKVAEITSKQNEIDQLSADKAALTLEVGKAKQSAQTWKRRYEEERANKDTGAALAACDSMGAMMEQYIVTVTKQLIAADSIIEKQSEQINRQNKILHASEKQIAILDSSIRVVADWNRKLSEQIVVIDHKHKRTKKAIPWMMGAAALLGVFIAK